ncbi:MAG: transcription elongation factor GreA [Candidatus Saccharimonadales bacterium]
MYKQETLKHFLTPAGHESLRKKLYDYKFERRNNIAHLKQLKEEQSTNTLVEDSGYIQIITRNDFLESEIMQIELLLSKSHILHSTVGKKKNEVTLGSSVTLQTDDGKTMEYTLVESIEADPILGKISSDSPIGRQLLGKRLQEIISLPSRSSLKAHTLRLIGIQ